MSTHTAVIAAGCKVYQGSDEFLIQHVLDLENVLAVHTVTGAQQQLRIHELTPAPPPGDGTVTDLDLTQVAPADWEEAQRRFGFIQPVLSLPRRTKEAVKAQATAAGVHIATVYRWLKQFERMGRVSALLPEKPNGGRDQSRIAPSTETILQATIENYYLHKQQRSVQKTCEEVEKRCRNAGVPVPHFNTVRNRISRLSDRIKLERRSQSQKAKQLYDLRSGRFSASWPLAVVQIDHTKLDIILVDSVHRSPVGRPWITLAFDVYSRLVAGLYVSFDPPGAMSTGLCIAHAILPKEKWLARLGLDVSWPCWGKMQTIHVDNAKEFRGSMLDRACQEHGIDLQFRPVATPHFGGHIERMLGTLAKEIHALPGTTFSHPAMRAEYDPDGQAAMTLPEFERWLTTYITQVYHQKLHTGLGTSPSKQYEKGIFGDGKQPGTGLPPRILDEDRIRLDFMPFEERTIQGYGIVIDEVHYANDVLRSYVHRKNEDGTKQKFLFRRDPRDISVVYFFDPDQKEYSAVPYRDSSRPAISLWELRESTKLLKSQGASVVDEAAIFAAYEQMRHLEEVAKKTTKKVRRSHERRIGHRHVHASVLPPPVDEADPDPPSFDAGTIMPFDELEEL